MLDRPTSEDSHLQKAYPRLHVNGSMVPTEKRLHMKEATYDSQIADDKNITFLCLLFVSYIYIIGGNKFPFDPGGNYLGATDYPYHYITCLKSSNCLSTLSRDLVSQT